jgi:carboxymethylenebutenolidase
MKLIVMLRTTLQLTTFDFVLSLLICGLTVFPVDAQTKDAITGKLITLETSDHTSFRAYMAGPVNADAGIIFIHDFFGFSKAMERSVRQLGNMGYLTIAVDLYQGKSAVTNESAALLSQSLDTVQAMKVIRAGINHLSQNCTRLGAIGFSAGGIYALRASLTNPELFQGTVIVYGGDYDKIDEVALDKVTHPILAITGSSDEWAVDASLNFFANHGDKPFEMYFYPLADHGYAQPLFLEGNNYDPKATAVTWLLIEDFLRRNLK